MITHCPHCNQKYDVESDSTGKLAHCSTCDKDFVVSPPASIKPNPNLKKCWCCAGMISTKAKVCPHCGAPMGDQFGLSIVIMCIGVLLAGWAGFDLMKTREPVLMMVGAVVMGFVLLLASISLKK